MLNFCVIEICQSNVGGLTKGSLNVLIEGELKRRKVKFNSKFYILEMDLFPNAFQMKV
jgi:hypothetical protein